MSDKLMKKTVIESAAESMRPENYPVDRVRMPMSLTSSLSNRVETSNTRLLWAGVFVLVSLAIAVVLFLNFETLLQKVFYTLAFLYVCFLILRYPFLKEHKYRAQFLDRRKNDYRLELSDLWGIASISEGGFCIFKDKSIGYFIILNKGSLVGSTEEHKRQHDRAVSDALNYARSRGVTIAYIDLMDTRGGDFRIRQDKQIAKANATPFTGLNELNGSILDYLDEKSKGSSISYDIIRFSTHNLNEKDLYNTLDKFLGLILQGMYTGRGIANKQDIGVIVKSYFNLKDFSVDDAVSSVYSGQVMRGWKILSRTFEDGTEEVFEKSSYERSLAMQYSRQVRSALVKSKQERAERVRQEKMKKRRGVPAADNKEKVNEVSTFDPFQSESFGAGKLDEVSRSEVVVSQGDSQDDSQAYSPFG